MILIFERCTFRSNRHMKVKLWYHIEDDWRYQCVLQVWCIKIKRQKFKFKRSFSIHVGPVIYAAWVLSSWYLEQFLSHLPFLRVCPKTSRVMPIDRIKPATIVWLISEIWLLKMHMHIISRHHDSMHDLSRDVLCHFAWCWDTRKWQKRNQTPVKKKGWSRKHILCPIGISI